MNVSHETTLPHYINVYMRRAALVVQLREDMKTERDITLRALMYDSILANIEDMKKTVEYYGGV